MGDNCGKVIFLISFFLCCFVFVSASSETAYFIVNPSTEESVDNTFSITYYLFDFLLLVFAIGFIFFLYKIGFFANIFRLKNVTVKKRSFAKGNKSARKRRKKK